jgi:hypothetical protein
VGEALTHRDRGSEATLRREGKSLPPPIHAEIAEDDDLGRNAGTGTCSTCERELSAWAIEADPAW